MLLHNQYEFDPNSDKIGEGGSARVYKAFDKNLLIYVALKRYDKKGDTSSALTQIRKYFKLRHTNIVCNYGCFTDTMTNSYGETEEVEYGVMEYADAGDFSQLINKTIKLSQPEFDKIIIGIIDGLDYLHTPNPHDEKPVIIHLDITSNNILFSKRGGNLIPKICDFGISKEISLHTITATSTGFQGTVEYMAPEQFNEVKYGVAGKLKPNVDFWALGCLLYEYYTGKAPFGKRSDGDMPIAIQNNILDKEPNYPATIPTPYKELIKSCLIKNAKERVQSANELKDILNGIKKTPDKQGPDTDKPKEEENKIEKDQAKYFYEEYKHILIIVVIIVVILFLGFLFDNNIKNSTTSEEPTEIISEPSASPKSYTFANSVGEKYSYTGNSENGQPNGTGTAIYSNSDEYTGAFVNGLKEGDGIYIWADGEKFVGEYKNNKRNGFGKYYDKTGNLIEQGNYIDGELQ